MLFQHGANAGRQRDGICIPKSRALAGVLDYATCENAIGSKRGIDATEKLPGEGLKRPRPPLLNTEVAMKVKVEKLFDSWGTT